MARLSAMFPFTLSLPLLLIPNKPTMLPLDPILRGAVDSSSATRVPFS
jgi:hypothetical protein